MSTLGKGNFQTVRNFLSWYRNKEINLQPAFQRRSVWAKAAKSLLVDSVLREYPIPLVMLRDASDGTSTQYEVVDGQQRLTTLLAFVAPDLFDKALRFELSPTHARAHGGLRFEDLPASSQESILDYQLTVFMLRKTVSDEHILDIFARLNTTGVKLNGQEVRNAIFSGSFKQYVNDFTYRNYTTWKAIGLFSEKDFLRMLDAEFVSDISDFIINGTGAFSQSNLNRLYQHFDGEFKFEEEVRGRFSFVLSQLVRVIEKQPSKSLFRSKTWFYALFCHAYYYIFGDEPLEREVVRRQLPSSWSELGSRLDAKLQDNSPESQNLRVTARTTNKNSRQGRNKLLGELIYGSSWKVPDKL